MANNELHRHKKSDAIKWVAIFVIVILLALVVFALFAKVYNAACWLKRDYGEDGICARCGLVKPIDEDKPTDDDEQNADVGGGMEMDEEKVIQNGIALLSTDIPRALFGEYDIAPIAETAKQLTATITPADAENKVVDWSVAWKNGSSTWAKGKTVTDYVTVTPTSDGALTANVACLKAFGEQVIVTVAVRNEPAINATATVDYEQRVVGIDFSLKCSASSPWGVTWSLAYSNVNATIAFPYFNASYGGEYWQQTYMNTLNTTVNFTPHFSDYTKSAVLGECVMSIAPTATYIAALKAAGFTTTTSAGTFVSIGSFPTVSGMLIENFVSNYTQIVSGYSTLRNYLKNNSSADMLQLKLVANGNSKNVVTVYNIKFSSASLTTLAEGISIGSNIVF